MRGHASLAQALTLREQPFLERRFLKRKAFEELTAVQIGRALESLGVPLADRALERDDVHVDGGGFTATDSPATSSAGGSVGKPCGG